MTDTITPEVGKTYLTRDGRKARCICTDTHADEYPVVCLVENAGAESIRTYTAAGHFRFDRSVSGCDLVSEAPRVVTVEVWVELLPDGGVVIGWPGRFDPTHVTGTVVKITQDVELPSDSSLMKRRACLL